MENPKTIAKAKKEKGNTSVIATEVALTGIMFGIVGVTSIGGLSLMGIIHIPLQIAHWVGAGLVAYVIIGGLIITHLCVKQMLTKKG